MKKFWWSALYLAVIGILSNFVAKFIPRQFSLDTFPFKCYPFEQDGKFYEKFQIRRWKNQLPDMSKVLRFMPSKKLNTRQSSTLQQLIQETCVAEIVHFSLILLSLLIFLWWNSPWAVLFVLLYNLLGNLPYMMIQRYNRPRMIRLLNKIDARKENAHG